MVAGNRKFKASTTVLVQLTSLKATKNGIAGFLRNYAEFFKG